MKTTRDALNNLFKIIRHFPEKENEEFYSSNTNIDKAHLPAYVVSTNPKFLGPQIYKYDLIKLVKDKLAFLFSNPSKGIYYSSNNICLWIEPKNVSYNINIDDLIQRFFENKTVVTADEFFKFLQMNSYNIDETKISKIISLDSKISLEIINKNDSLKKYFQEIQKKHSTKIFLGHSYKNRYYDPNNLNQFDNVEDSRDSKRDIYNNNNYVLEEYKDLYRFGNTIHVACLRDYWDYYNTKSGINFNFITGFITKYWPYYLTKKTGEPKLIGNSKEDYLAIGVIIDSYKESDELHKLLPTISTQDELYWAIDEPGKLETVKIKYTDSSVIQLLMHYNLKQHISEIDMYNIFRNFKVSKEFPLIKYRDNDTKFKIFKNIKSVVSQNILESWVKPKKEKEVQVPKGISIKYLSYTTTKCYIKEPIKTDSTIFTTNEKYYLIKKIGSKAIIRKINNISLNVETTVDNLTNIITDNRFSTINIRKNRFELYSYWEECLIATHGAEPYNNFKTFGSLANNIIEKIYKQKIDTTKWFDITSMNGSNLKIVNLNFMFEVHCKPFDKSNLRLFLNKFKPAVIPINIQSNTVHFKYTQVSKVDNLPYIDLLISNLNQKVSTDIILSLLSKKKEEGGEGLTDNQARIKLSNWKDNYNKQNIYSGIDIKIVGKKGIYKVFVEGVKRVLDTDRVRHFITNIFIEFLDTVKLTETVRNSSVAKKSSSVESAEDANLDYNNLVFNSASNQDSRSSNNINNNNSSAKSNTRKSNTHNKSKNTKKSPKNNKTKNSKSYANYEDIDENTNLGKLKAADKELFFPKGVKYASNCQYNVSRQPIVVKYNPDELIQKKEINENALEKGEGKYVHYGSSDDPNQWNYYICPKIFCYLCNKPLSKTELINTQIVANQYTKATCKYCKTTLKTDDNPTGQLYIARDTAGPHRFPGFLDKSKTQHTEKKKGMICCFKTARKRWNEYLPKYMKNEAVEIKNEKYILGEEKYPLEERRIGLLPKNINLLINKTPQNPKGICGTRVDGTGNLVENSRCIFRYGINQNYDSFLSAVFYTIQDTEHNLYESSKEFNTNWMGPNVAFKNFKQFIVDRINLAAKKNKWFLKSINGGLFSLLFKSIPSYDGKNESTKPSLSKTTGKNSNILDKIKNYFLNSENSYSPSIIQDLLSRPGILYPEGVNILIFYKNSEGKIMIKCPKGTNINDIYNPNKFSLVFYTFEIGKKSLFEPVYSFILQNEGSEQVLKISKIFNNSDKIIQVLTKQYPNDCVPYHSKKDKLRINKYISDNIQKDLSKKDSLYLDELYAKLTTGKAAATFKMLGLEPVYQIIDNFNRVVGLYTNQKLFIPVANSGIFLDNANNPILNIKKLNEIELLKVNNILTKLGILSNRLFDYLTPIALVGQPDLNDERNFIINGILTSSLDIIPCQKTNQELSNEYQSLPKIKYNYYLDAESGNQAKVDNSRVNFSKFKEYKVELYQRMRFELSRYLSTNLEIKNSIKKILENKDKIKQKRDKIIEILYTIFKEISTFKRINDITFKENIPKKRVICSSLDTSNRQAHLPLTTNTNEWNKMESLHCNINPFCSSTPEETENGKHGFGRTHNCKLYIPDIDGIDSAKILKTNIMKISDELVRYIFKRNEILNNTISDLLNPKEIFLDKDTLLLNNSQNIKVEDLYKFNPFEKMELNDMLHEYINS